VKAGLIPVIRLLFMASPSWMIFLHLSTRCPLGTTVLKPQQSSRLPNCFSSSAVPFHFAQLHKFGLKTPAPALMSHQTKLLATRFVAATNWA
jgi:hypothetical protein